MACFDPPMSSTTFHRWANEGRFASSGVPGRYLLNKTRKKLGLPPADTRPFMERIEDISTNKREKQLFQAALAVTIPECIDAGLPIELPSEMTTKEATQVMKKHKELYETLASHGIVSKESRVAFVVGALQI